MANNDNNGGQSGQPGQPGAVLHFLKALGHAALAYGHIAFNEEPDETEAEEAAQPRRLKRPSGRRNGGSKKSCCIARR